MKKYRPFIKFICFAIVAAFWAWKGQPFVHDNEKAIDIIINVFSILAGFLIAILTLFSDMRFDESANWRKLELQEAAQQQKYGKHSLLFFAYLFVLVVVFLVVLLTGQANSSLKDSQVVVYLERIYLFLAVLSVIYSLFLPSNLLKIRKQEFDRLQKSKLPKSSN